jgi:signal transduction histidine kinase
VTPPPPGIAARFLGLLRRSFAARLITIAALSIAGLVLIGWLAYSRLDYVLQRILIDPEIEAVADDLIAKTGRGLLGEAVLSDLPLDTRYMQLERGRYYQIARIRENGTLDVQVRSPSLLEEAIAVDPQTRARLVGEQTAPGPQFLNIRGPENEALRVVARVARPSELDGRYLYLVGAAPRVIVGPASAAVRWALPIFILFLAAMVAGATILQARFVLAPLRALRSDIASVRRGDSDRLAGDYPAELQPVTNELNALVDHNREVVERARRHVGNLAHALKTPIAVLKNAAAAGQEDAVLKQSIEEMEGFVERQLRRARVAARAEANAGPQAATISYRTPVRENLEDLVFMMEQKYDTQKAVDISLEANGDVTFRGEREDLLEMAANLVDNACKYGGSRVVVRLSPAAQGAFEIVVEDDGPGLSDVEIDRAMARGARLDEAAPGQGLGLSILKETVELYAGELMFERSALGGLKARLRLPATD